MKRIVADEDSSEEERLRIKVSGELKGHLGGFAARLEAIEARRSAIERILRERGTESEAS